MGYKNDIEQSKAWLLSKLIYMDRDTLCWGNLFQGKWQPGVLTTAIVLIGLQDTCSGGIYLNGIRYLISNQRETGGWSTRNIYGGDASTTAFCLDALLRLPDVSQFKDYIIGGVRFLISLQTQDGGFRLLKESETSYIATGRALGVLKKISDRREFDAIGVHQVYEKGLKWMEREFEANGSPLSLKGKNMALYPLVVNGSVYLADITRPTGFKEKLSKAVGDAVSSGIELRLLEEETFYSYEYINKERRDIFYQRWWVILPALVEFINKDDKLSIYDKNIQSYVQRIITDKCKEGDQVFWGNPNDSGKAGYTWVTAGNRLGLLQLEDYKFADKDVKKLIAENSVLREIQERVVPLVKIISEEEIRTVEKIINQIKQSRAIILGRGFFASARAVAVGLIVILLITTVIIIGRGFISNMQFNWKIDTNKKLLLAFSSGLLVTSIILIEAWMSKRSNYFIAIMAIILSIILACIKML